ncbi:MAG TPA: rcc01693 family protein [Devosiaceae bacterium]|nr:rcc01693 family protein [Devosiaceae bacterium]
MTAFPWNDAMRFGFGTLRLSSRDFWGLTPRELAAAVEGAAGRSRPRPPDRSTMGRLMAAFPDKESFDGR